MSVSTVQERAAALFAYLVSESSELQSAAIEGDALPKLALMIICIRNNENKDNDAQNIIIRSASNDKLYEVLSINLRAYFLLLHQFAH
jgi:hypothetical protein